MERDGSTRGPGEPENGARLIAGRISCLAGLLLALGGIAPALVDGSPAVTPGALGIGLGILGHFLGASRLAVVTVVVGVAALYFAVAASAGYVPGLEPAGPGQPG